MNVKMNVRRWGLAVLGAFGVLVIGDYLVHEVWLGAFYRQTMSWWRPAASMRALMPLMVAGQFSLAVLLTLVYAKGYEAGKGTLGQGFRFGVLMGLLLCLPKSFMTLFIYPYPVNLVLNWFVAGVIETTVAGLVIGKLYVPEWKL